MRLIVLMLLAALLALGRRAGAATVSVPAAVDVGPPFWCDRGDEWDERWHRDDGPRLRCNGRSHTLGAHRILSADCYDERELEFDETTASATLASAEAPQWLSSNVTALARAWHRGVIANDGVILKLGEEDYEVSGPYLPSVAYANPAVRRRVIVDYAVPSG